MKISVKRKNIGLTAGFYILAVACILVITNACNKGSQAKQAAAVQDAAINTPTPLQQGVLQTKVVSVLAISPVADGGATWVIFRGLQERFNVTDPAVVAALQTAYTSNQTIKITFDPWQAIVSQVSPASDQERISFGSRPAIKSTGASRMVDLATANPEAINSPVGMAVVNTTTPGLTDVVPDMATAQLMFDYIAHQCCEVPGPYGVDYCITFQYCEDGCYARAHKMCYILNNRYHYATHKVFSFAYPGTYSLCVKAEKWGGCCIRWWYHVAPLVNIKTPAGTKAYVFDPAMFDEPVLLATWLHAQQNPACAGSHIPKVTSYNIQPTSSYEPYDTSSFSTDPTYSATDATLTSYHSLISCP